MICCKLPPSELSCRPQGVPAAKPAKSPKRRNTANSQVGVSIGAIGGFNGMLAAYLVKEGWDAAPRGLDNKLVVFHPSLVGDGYCFWRSLNACDLLLNTQSKFPVDISRRVDYGSAGSILFDVLGPVAISRAAPLQSCPSCPYIAFVCRSRDTHWSVVVQQPNRIVQQPNRTYYINESRQYYKAGQHASALVQFFADHNDDLEHRMLHLHLHCHHQ